MKIKFDPNQLHQRQAWESAIGVFEGQETCYTTFAMPTLSDEFEEISEEGTGNRLRIPDEDLLANVQNIQLKNGLRQSQGLNGKNFTIEMETGTGKTYVYLRSIFEMNKLYGFTKFIIVVPSIAIKEGVYKSLQMTENHFKELYDKTPFDYFVYDSARLEQVRNFSGNDYIQIMIINIDAFRKSFQDPTKESSTNIIHRWNDKMQGVPIQFIHSTNPVVIIDEPQSVDTTEKSAEAIQSLNPLCTFRYSATHIDKHNMLYKLDSIDAHEQKLVKQIEMSSAKVKDGHNKPYIKLLAVDNKNGHKARVEIDIQQKGSIKRTTKLIKQGDDLMQVTKRDLYDGYMVDDIYCKEGEEYISFTGKADIIRLNQAIGDVNDDEYKRLQIRLTIEEHLEKELRLTNQGIKVLSLFFIDKVANYRDAKTKDGKGKYALMFEEEYAEAIKKPKYKDLFSGMDIDSLPQQVHNGYFSQDKNGFKDTKGNTKADADTYSLIMKDKEKLLQFSSKLKFIFSHSALKEGWDNPNVFQICTLNETKSTIKKRQEIGRGLRICVNQDGDRVHGSDTNTLTVMANESYEDFVKNLQKEMEEEQGIIFGAVKPHLFANITITNERGEIDYLGETASQTIYDNLLENSYIDVNGKVTDELKLALKENKLKISDTYEEQRPEITRLLKKITGGLNIKNRDDKRPVKLNKAVFDSPEFKELWDKIKYKTTYDVKFDSDRLIEKCAESIRNDLIGGKTTFQHEKVTIEVNQASIEAKEKSKKTYRYDVKDYKIPDILGYLQNETNLKRDSILKILLNSGKLNSFKDNPQKFIDQAKEIIKRQMSFFLVDGIKYKKLGNDHYYAQELFENEELIGYLNKNMAQAKRSVYSHVVYDSDVEMNLAKSFEENDEVKVYAKLPSWFKIDTPLGTYNPDWAVLFQSDGEEKLYLVVESKDTITEELLRPSEIEKFKCGKKHFTAMNNETQCILTDNYDTLINRVKNSDPTP